MNPIGIESCKCLLPVKRRDESVVWAAFTRLYTKWDSFTPCEYKTKQGGVEELGSSQSGGTEQGVLVGKRDGLMRLLARREMMMMIFIHALRIMI